MQAHDMDPALPPPHVAFHKPPRDTFQHTAAACSGDYAMFLAHRVSSQPHDLEAHVRRIQYHLDTADSAALFGALADLFIALGSRGYPLRLRLLERAAPLLPAAELALLFEHVDSGLGADTALPDCHHSRLTRPSCGLPLPLATADEKAVIVADPLFEAREQIERGALEEARQTLRAALAANPERAELADELSLLERYLTVGPTS